MTMDQMLAVTLFTNVVMAIVAAWRDHWRWATWFTTIAAACAIWNELF